MVQQQTGHLLISFNTKRKWSWYFFNNCHRVDSSDINYRPALLENQLKPTKVVNTLSSDPSTAKAWYEFAFCDSRCEECIL